MRERILNALTDAMKTRNKEVLSVIRMVKGAMQLEEINKKRELNDEEVIAVIGKQIKTRKESILEFEKGNRNDLIDQVKSEIVILEKYMPTQLSEDEIAKVIDEVFNNVKPQNVNEIGKIMGAVTPLLKGKADMSIVNRIVKEKLSSL